MLITESQMNIGRGFDVMGLLDNMAYLTEAESTYAPAMVPVVESNDYQAHLIKLEDMMSFSEANGIEDLGYALTLVCEASEIDPSTVAFTVQEESIIADPEVASLAGAIMNEGVRIAAVPVNPNHPAAQLADIAVDSLIESGDDYTFNYILTELAAGADTGEIYGSMGGDANEDEQVAMSKQDPGSGSTRKNTTGPDKNAVDGLLNKVKNVANKGRNVIARFLARLRGYATRIDAQIKLDMAKNNKTEMSIWQKIKTKVAQAIAWLTQKMANAIGTENVRGKDAKKFGKLKDHEFGVNDKTDWGHWKAAAGRMKEK